MAYFTLFHQGRFVFVSKNIFLVLFLDCSREYFSKDIGFYPTAVKGCRGIVFTHGVRMGGRSGRWRKKVCQGCISETVRCRKLIVGRDIGLGV